MQARFERFFIFGILRASESCYKEEKLLLQAKNYEITDECEKLIQPVNISLFAWLDIRVMCEMTFLSRKDGCVTLCQRGGVYKVAIQYHMHATFKIQSDMRRTYCQTLSDILMVSITSGSEWDGKIFQDF